MREEPEPIERLKGRDWLVAAAVLVLLAIPILFTKYAVVADYFLHMGRMDILARAGDRYLAGLYEVRWAVLPNLAMDILVPPLARLIGLLAAGKVFMLLIVWLQATGGAAVMYALERRPSPLMLLPAALVYNRIFSWGFTNYLFGIGIALWAFALWILWRDRSPALRLATFLGLTVVLYLSHMVAVGIFFVSVGAFEAGHFLLPSLRPRARRDNLALLAALAVLPAALYLFFSPVTSAKTLAWNSLSGKAGILAGFLTSMATEREKPLLPIAVLGVAAALLLRWVRLNARMAAVAATLLALVLAAPWMLHNSAYFDTRLTLPLYMFLVCGLGLTSRGQAVARPLAWVLAYALVAKIALQTIDWHRENERFAAAERALDGVPEGAMIISISDPMKYDPTHPWWQEPILASLGRNVYVPQLWLDRAQQPVWIRDPFLPIKAALGHDPVWHKLGSPELLAEVKKAAAIYRSNMAYLGYGAAPVYVVSFHKSRDTVPRGPIAPYREVSRGADFILYEVGI